MVFSCLWQPKQYCSKLVVKIRRCLAIFCRAFRYSSSTTALPEVCKSMKPDLSAKRDQLLATLRALDSVAVAFSGGIDSTVVAQAALLVIVCSPLLSPVS